MNVRSVAAVVFLVAGSLMTIPASLTIWQERTLLNEDRFVETVVAILDDEAVQAAVASRTTDAVMEQLDLSARIDSAIIRLDESSSDNNARSLTVLERSIISVAREAVYRVCLRLIQSDIGSDARELVLRTVHRSFMAIVQNDGEYLKVAGGRVILDLGPLIDDAIRNVASDKAADAVAARRPEAGEIVLVENRNQSPVWRLLGWIDDLDPIVPIISIALLATAVLLAHNRMRMIGIIGGSVVVTSALVLLLAGTPLKELATSWPPRPEGQEAAAAAYDILLDSFRRQQLFVVIGGVSMMALSVTRQTHLLRAIREEVSSAGREDVEGLRPWVRQRLSILRGAGLAAAALVLLIWPDPTPRVFATVLALAILYLGLLWAVVSDAELAMWLRREGGRIVHPAGARAAGPNPNFVARWSGPLRISGGVIALAILLVTPDVTLRLCILTLTGALLYMAGIDYLASPRRDNGDQQ